MMTRSSAYRSSQGTPARNSRDKASSTMMKSKGLSTDPWWTSTFTSNSWLKPTQTRLCKLAYIPWTNRAIHSSTPSFLRAHQITFRRTRSNAFSRSTKAIKSLMFTARHISCSCWTTCLVRPSTILSMIFMACSVSWGLDSCLCPEHHPYSSKGRQ